MAAIAAEAGVAPKTVYVAFETESGLLRALWHLLLRGDEQDIPVGDRRWYRDVVEERDPRRQIELAAHNSRLGKERAANPMRVIRSAATRTSRRSGAASSPTSTRTRARSCSRCTTRARCAAGSASTVAPTSCGR
jgi:AcrR family transcriptional regulator